MDRKSGLSAGAPRDRREVRDKWRQVSDGFLLIDGKLFRTVLELNVAPCRKNSFEAFIMISLSSGGLIRWTSRNS